MVVTRRRPLRAGSLRPPARLFKGYAIDAPFTRVFRERISCEAADCSEYRSGWGVKAELLDPQMWAWIRAKRYRWRRVDLSPTEQWITFEAGQPCFRSDTHTRLVRDPLFVEHRGARWGRTGDQGRRHNADTWVDSFAEHQDKLAEEARRG